MDWLKNLNDEKLISELELIARSHQQGDWWSELPTPVKESIAKGQQDYQDGNVMSRAEAKELLRSRMKS